MVNERLSMRDNVSMVEHLTAENIEEDAPALEVLRSCDPAGAADIAEGLASSLQRELDRTGVSTDPRERDQS